MGAPGPSVGNGEKLTAEYITRCLKTVSFQTRRRGKKKKRHKNLTENRKNKEERTHPSTSTHTHHAPPPVYLHTVSLLYFLSPSPLCFFLSRGLSAAVTLCPFSLSVIRGCWGCGHIAGSTPSLKFNIAPRLHNEGRKGRQGANEPPTAAFTAESPRVILSFFFFPLACETLNVQFKGNFKCQRLQLPTDLLTPFIFPCLIRGAMDEKDPDYRQCSYHETCRFLPVGFRTDCGVFTLQMFKGELAQSISL